MLKIFNKKMCYGCGACLSACPAGAISMRPDSEGFLYPETDENLCVRCGKCQATCPSGGQSFSLPVTSSPPCYAVAGPEEARLSSSSGGVYWLLARQVIEHGGLVCGAAFDDAFELMHVIAHDQQGLERLRRSKYLQSDIGDCFIVLQKELESGKTALFSGTPCQVAGLYGFLGTDYDNLLTVDVFCHGVPSPLVFKKYLSEIADIEEITDINFRDKAAGWENFNFTVTTKSAIRSLPHSDDAYMRGFLSNLYLRPSCSTCAFATLPRPSDISLGDFWGIDKICSKYNDDKGLSAVLLNTAKGEKNFKEAVIRHAHACWKMPLTAAIKGNPVLNAPSLPHKNRSAFFGDLAVTPSVTELIDEYLGARNVGIMNLYFSNESYGALMVAYSLAMVVRRLGYPTCMINFVPPDYSIRPSIFEDFRNRFLTRTKLCRTWTELEELNGTFSRLIVGSDQVWRFHYDYLMTLSWAYGSKTLVAYAASFGLDYLEKGVTDAKTLSGYLKRFDAISVRERSGVDICEEHLGVEAIQVLDPTLLLKQEDYEEIIQTETVDLPANEYIAYMLLDNEDNLQMRNPHLLTGLKTKYHFINALFDENGQNRSFAAWLNCIKHAKYFITNSFHGSVFAIIFEKEFATVANSFRGKNRLVSLFNSLSITGRLFEDISDINEDVFENKLDYALINEQLCAERARSLDFLAEALRIQPTPKKNLAQVTQLKLFNIVPLATASRFGRKTVIRLFNMLPVLKLKTKKRTTYYYLFCFLPVAKTKKALRTSSLTLYLFNFFPILKLNK